VTVSEALRLLAPEPVDHIFPARGFDANFDVWIGAEEDNQAWTHCCARGGRTTRPPG